MSESAEPVEQPIEEQPIEEEPTGEPVEEQPAEEPAEEQPAEEEPAPAEEQPAEEEPAPAEEPAEEPAPVEEQPAEEPAEEEKPAEEEPAPAEEQPAEEPAPVEEKPVEEPVEEKPVEKPAAKPEVKKAAAEEKPEPPEVKKPMEDEKAAAEIAKIWKTAGSKVGLEIWRIENFKVVPQPQSTFGSFYSGDSYIVLNTYTLPGRKALQWDVHFWLGKDSTQDEMGTAAYKTVELDDYLGGGPVQHREVQGYESQLFQSYFPHGMRIMEGGVESGFNKVKPKEYKPRLLQLKGRKRVRLVEVPLEAKSVNSGDVFILDLGLLLIQFNGKDSSGRERIKAAEICRALDEERSNIPDVVVFEEFAKLEDWPKEWTDLLGSGPYATAEEGGDDLEFEKVDSTRTLYRLSDASGTLEMTKICEGSVSRDKLDGDDVFILDVGNEIFTWVGLGASKNERREAMKHAMEYIEKNGKPTTIPVTVTMQGAESKYFWSFFSS